MKYIWSYLKKYPKWLMLDFFGAVFFVVVNLGLPTVLARMIDEGINRGDSNRLYYWAIVMLIARSLWTDCPCLCCWEINDEYGTGHAQ